MVGTDCGGDTLWRDALWGDGLWRGRFILYRLDVKVCPVLSMSENKGASEKIPMENRETIFINILKVFFKYFFNQLFHILVTNELSIAEV